MRGKTLAAAPGLLPALGLGLLFAWRNPSVPVWLAPVGLAHVLVLGLGTYLLAYWRHRARG